MLSLYQVHLSRYPYDVTEELKDELDFYLIDIPELTKYVLVFSAISYSDVEEGEGRGERGEGRGERGQERRGLNINANLDKRHQIPPNSTPKSIN